MNTQFNAVMVRNAPVIVTAHEARNARGNARVYARAEIAGKYEYNFSPDSRVSKELALMSPADLSKRLSGGHFFFVNDRMIDFRYGMYDGFVHSDESIKRLIDVVGILDVSKMTARDRPFKKSNTLSHDLMLGNIWSNCPIVVPGYAAEGGKFASQLSFSWNPFTKSVKSLFRLVRELCENGMIGLGNFLNTEIPLINRWEEHLEIANKQIQNKVEVMAKNRFQQMRTERASVEEVTQLYVHATRRGKAAAKEGREVESEKLARIAKIVDPAVHLGAMYHEQVFRDQRLAAQHPAHLTTFDAYNMATEMRSHTTSIDESTDNALDRYANRILFDRKNLTKYARRGEQPRLSMFSNPDEAFFGLVH